MSNEENSNAEDECVATPVVHLSGTELARSPQDRQSRQGWGVEESTQRGLIGDRSARRVWANEADFFLAAISAMSIVIVLPDFDPLLKGLSFYLFYLLYYQLTESLGATPAKWWFGLCVRSSDGRRASFWQVAIQTVSRIVETNPIFLGVFPAAFFVLCTRRHLRFGDWLAGTVVVRVENLAYCEQR
ncbi:MAG: hypothetical protein JWP89_4872 [Schlesneria sp.]|nr:hypothetical protein [Schlesneria sp.]